jgi:GcrA cell cycle regulator
MFSDPPSPDAALRYRGPSIWTPERERRAIRLYLAEGFTAADVADALGAGFSRAAVIGKMRRLGCLKREVRGAPTNSCAAKPGRKPPRAASVRTATRLPPQRPPQPLPPLREIGAVGSPATLACLPAGACRWPIDDPGPGRMHLARFCGGAATAGVYCAAHRALAVRRPA